MFQFALTTLCGHSIEFPSGVNLLHPLETSLKILRVDGIELKIYHLSYMINLTPIERRDRVARLILRGIHLYAKSQGWLNKNNNRVVPGPGDSGTSSNDSHHMKPGGASHKKKDNVPKAPSLHA